MPPPTATTRPKFSMWVGVPRGPTRTGRESPTLKPASSWVVLPTTWKIRVMEPSSTLASAMVRGTRSP